MIRSDIQCMLHFEFAAIIAVNNSNTAGAGIASILDRIGSSPLLSKIPFGQQVIGQPALGYMIRMMRGVVTSGTGTRAAISGSRCPKVKW